MEQKNWEKLVLAGSPDIVMVADQSGSIVYINHLLPSFTMEQVIGSSINNYIPPAYHEAYKEALKEVFEKATPQEFIVTGSGPDNTTAWYLTRIGPIQENGQVVAAAVISTDITKLMELDDDLMSAKREVDRLTKEIADFQKPG